MLFWHKSFEIFNKNYFKLQLKLLFKHKVQQTIPVVILN